MRPVGDVGSVLFGRTRRLVLGWLLGHPDEAYYVRQIVRETGAAQGAIQRELETLAEAGLLVRTTRGRQVYFQANQQSPVFRELQGLLMKTAGAADVLREALAPLADRIVVAFVFGSAARGELTRDSDVDLLVIGDVAFADVASALSAAQARLGRDVNPSVFARREFEAKVAAGHHFLTSILRESRVVVIGTEHELERLGTQRLADAPPHEPARDRRPARGDRARPGRQRR